MLSYVAFLLAGIVGIAIHFAKRRVKEESSSSFRDYYFKNHVGYTIASVVGFIVSLVVLAKGHAGHLMDPSVLIEAFSAGYMIDSFLNKDSAPLAATPMAVAAEVMAGAGEAAPAQVATVVAGVEEAVQVAADAVSKK